jgi:hypothetical protein
MITPLTLITAMRKNIKNADVMFTQGKCYQLYLMLADLYPNAIAWYEPVDGHVFTQIGDKFYDINGEHESLPERSHLFAEEVPGSLKNAFECDYPVKAVV